MNWEVLPSRLRTVGPAALALNLIGLALGFCGAKLAPLDGKQALAIAIEFGMQNAASATFVTATLLGSVTPAIYAMLMVPSALIFGMIARRLLLHRPPALKPPTLSDE